MEAFLRLGGASWQVIGKYSSVLGKMGKGKIVVTCRELTMSQLWSDLEYDGIFLIDKTPLQVANIIY